DTASFPDIQRLVVCHPRIFGIVLQLQPRRQLNITLGAQIIHVVSVGVVPKKSILTVKTAAYIKRRFVISAGKSEVVVLGKKPLFVQLVIPVCAVIILIFTGRRIHFYAW